MIFRAIETLTIGWFTSEDGKNGFIGPGGMSPRNFFFNFYEVIAVLVLFEKLLRLILFVFRLKFDFFIFTKYEAFL